MKKTLLLFACAGLFIAGANAQVLKQEAKENNLQVLFTPLGGNPISNDGIGITYRKFCGTGTAAWRVSLNVGSTKSTSIWNQEGDTMSFPTSVNMGDFTLKTGKNPETQIITKST